MDAENKWHELWYLVIVYPDDPEGNYEVGFRMDHTYRHGPRFIYENVVRAFKGGKLFPLRPFLESKSDLLKLKNHR